jgi:hypothetical protein
MDEDQPDRDHSHPLASRAILDVERTKRRKPRNNLMPAKIELVLV